MKVNNSVVLITGASEGIGRATAKLLSSKGAKVAIAARSKDKLDILLNELSDGLTVQVDMTKPLSIQQMVKSVNDHYGRIDILINNAGQALRSPVVDIKIEDFQKIIDLNLYGPLLALQAVVPLMKKQGGGMVLNISSNVSKMSIPGIGAYASTKYALNGLMLTARNELASEGIVIGLMHPGRTATSFGENAIKGSSYEFHSPAGMQADTPEVVAEKILEAIINQPAEQYVSKEAELEFGGSA